MKTTVGKRRVERQAQGPPAEDQVLALVPALPRPPPPSPVGVVEKPALLISLLRGSSLKRGSEEAAGLDVSAAARTYLQPKKVCAVPTGIENIRMAQDQRHAYPASRSSLALRGVNVVGASGNFSNFFVHNLNDEVVVLEKHERFGQLIFPDATCTRSGDLVLFECLPDLRQPEYSSSLLGYVLYSAEPVFLAKGEVTRVELGVSVKMPPNTYGQLSLHPLFLANEGSTVFLGAGVIDSDFCGGLSAIVFNLGEADVKVEMSRPFVVLRIVPVLSGPIMFQEKELNERRGESARGAEGFGSSGQF